MWPQARDVNGMKFKKMTKKRWEDWDYSRDTARRDNENDEAERQPKGWLYYRSVDSRCDWIPHEMRRCRKESNAKRTVSAVEKKDGRKRDDWRWNGQTTTQKWNGKELWSLEVWREEVWEIDRGQQRSNGSQSFTHSKENKDARMTCFTGRKRTVWRGDNRRRRRARRQRTTKLDDESGEK